MVGKATVIHLAGPSSTSTRSPPPLPALLASLPLTETVREKGKKDSVFGSASLSAQQGRPRFENLAASICQLLRVTGQKGPPARTVFANSDMRRKKKTDSLVGDESSHIIQNLVFGCLWPSNKPHRKGKKFILFVFYLPARNQPIAMFVPQTSPFQHLCHKQCKHHN